jgi:uncharacterized protein YheU (UPF0270 family)
LANFVQVPVERLQPDVFTALLEEYASRDGTDYGARELSLDEKVANLRRQLEIGDVGLVYDADSEEWDLMAAAELKELKL